jgi:DNA repair protein RecN (Recombination protein N)
MLTTLRIRNLALVDDLTLELSGGFVALTGETGAGKSIIIGALKLLLGERADRTQIRNGSDSCTVEAIFKLQQLGRPMAEYLAAHGLEPCADDELVLKRVFSTTGTNRQFVNGSPTTLQTLSEIGDWLVDLHGPHDHQSLLHPTRQLELLDAYARLDEPRTRFARLVAHRRQLLDARSALVSDNTTHQRQLDLLHHQLHEIESARLTPEDDLQLAQDHSRASNAARLLELAQTALHHLAGEDQSTLALASLLGRALAELHRLDPTAAALLTTHQQASTLLQDLRRDLEHYADRVDLDPDQLRQLEERLNLVQTLKRKYGPTLPDVLDSARHARSQLEALESRQTTLDQIHAELAQLDSQLSTSGADLSRQRQQAIPKLARAAASELAALGFQQSHFDIQLSSRPFDPSHPNASLSPSGFDSCEFLFSPNPGEPPRPLRSIASSGEMARVMLALKTTLATQDRIPLLIFGRPRTGSAKPSIIFSLQLPTVAGTSTTAAPPR